MKSKDATSFTVSLPFNPLAYEDTYGKEKLGERLSERLSEKLSEKESRIVDLIKENSFITATEIGASLLISRQMANRYISSLKNKNIIKRVGPDKGGHWEIIEEK